MLAIVMTRNPDNHPDLNEYSDHKLMKLYLVISYEINHDITANACFEQTLSVVGNSSSFVSHAMQPLMHFIEDSLFFLYVPFGTLSTNGLTERLPNRRLFIRK